MRNTTDRLTDAQVSRLNDKVNVAWWALNDAYQELTNLGFYVAASQVLKARGAVTAIAPMSTVSKGGE